MMEIGDTVYIIGSYSPFVDDKKILIEGQIDSIKHRQFVVHKNGLWAFSKKHMGKCVFTNKEDAIKILTREFKNHEMS